MRRPCYVVDAFAAAPLQGNAAGVVLDAAGLATRELQRIAAELKHSETAFPLPAREPGAHFHLRWFTPTQEVPFCGHATLAALHVLVDEAQRVRVPDAGVTRVAFTCQAGLLHAELGREQGRLRAWIETPFAAFEPSPVDAGLLAALGLVPELLDPRLMPQRCGDNVLVAVREREALARCRPDLAALPKQGGFVVYTLDAKGADAAVRCFFPADGIPEDPVTGSAAGQLATLLAQKFDHELPRRYAFTQGDEVGRPGRVEIEVRADSQPGRLRALIGGSAHVVLRGELAL